MQVVKFKGLTYGAELRHAKQGFETVGSTLAKCFLACCAERQGMQHFKILDNCSGYLMPGTLTLVCGPPGCGKSSLHKALAGRLHVDKNTTLQGSVKYNHKSIDRIQVRRLAAYIAQTDRHLPLLTVRETCEFANACTSHFTNNPEWYGKSAEKMEALQDEIGGVNLPLELTLHLLGLRGVSDTIVGNAAVRGVSGGERHRVTTAEMVSGTFLVYLLDEISTGLDSSATYDIVSAFRTMARIRRYTCLFSLLQPSPEVFNLFDRIIVMHEGRIIYQGPRDDVLLYFKKLGYVKPNHVDVADFLQEISTEEGVGYLTPGHKHLTVDGFVSAYMASDMYKDIVRILDNKQDAEELWLEAKKPLGLKITDGEITGDVVIQEVESSGTATVVDIQQTSQVKAGDKITAIGINHENLEYLTLPGTQKSDAETIVDKVQRAQDYVRLQLERPLEKALGFWNLLFLSIYTFMIINVRFMIGLKLKFLNRCLQKLRRSLKKSMCKTGGLPQRW
ncbi:hypothetical protein M758_11G105200 [Ceratodon purpureus]|nr:hypothetical protein M758_11G105200 [Ceratodon purpureus]